MCDNSSIAIVYLKNFNLGHSGKIIKDKESEANAKLIAASPDMLEALNNALSLINTIGCLQNMSFDEYFEVISIKNAIKKATE